MNSGSTETSPCAPDSKYPVGSHALLSGDSSPDDTVLRILKQEGTLEKITRPPSGGPYARTKARERTVSQGDQELGLKHHGSRYSNNPGPCNPETGYHPDSLACVCPECSAFQPGYPLPLFVQYPQVTEIHRHRQSVTQRHTSCQEGHGVGRGTRK